jgi:hypothetical protein
MRKRKNRPNTIQTQSLSLGKASRIYPMFRDANLLRFLSNSNTMNILNCDFSCIGVINKLCGMQPKPALYKVLLKRRCVQQLPLARC